MKNTVLVLGNGFDLDLRYPTGYRDFKLPFDLKDDANSHQLGKFLLHCKKVEEWGSLEKVLTEYGRLEPEKEYQEMLDKIAIPGSKIIGNTLGQVFKKFNNKGKMLGRKAKENQEDFDRLVYSVQDYIKTVDLSHPRENSMAARLIRALVSEEEAPAIYSFNYTNLQKIGDALGIKIENPVYVHGCADQGNIVLGAGDYSDFRPSARYLYKWANSNYQPTDLMDALNECDRVYFFGLSFCKVDTPYFQRFVRKISAGDYGPKKKYVRLFTYDDDSKIEMMSHLLNMSDSVISLMGHANVDIVRTKDGVDEAKFQQILEEIVN